MKRRFKNTPSRHIAGFTLVELLLAITLMSILLGLTYTGLRTATRSSQRGELMLAAGGELRASHQFIRRQLNQMLPLSFAETDDLQALRIVFEGDAQHIKFVAPMPGYLGTGGPQVQLVEVVNGEDDELVIQFSHALLQGFTDDRLYDRDPVILLERVNSAGFEFLGRDEEGELTGWTTDWDQQDILPVAVRLDLEFSEGLNLHWPDLAAGVRIDAQALQGVAGNMAQPGYEQSIKDLIKGRKEGES
ncbi:MAG: prepilin-type N-terminal cleavage/methylation domain-containing protein [Xanthomonadales bacterium]|nr:prepilin-type N-terminal cleavage/methylation domain-containing protein [Xanthomonadales bacterium]